MTHDSSTLLMGIGRDLARIFGEAPTATSRLDEHGWLELTGEAGSFDLNLAAVARGGSASLVEFYIGEIRARGLDAVLLIDEGALDLETAAESLGLVRFGAAPVMVWENRPAPTPTERYAVRLAGEDDVPTANALIAAAFSVDAEKIQRVFPPSVVTSGPDIWIAEDDDHAVGTGLFVQRDDCVGVYNMATPAQSQRRGIGRALLDTAMAHYLERGAATFTLEPSEAGMRLYQAVGFVTAATPSVFVVTAAT